MHVHRGAIADRHPGTGRPGAGVRRQVFAAQEDHAEVVAHRVGEPFGSLVLAVAVTVIEVALIVTLMVVMLTEVAIFVPSMQ